MTNPGVSVWAKPSGMNGTPKMWTRTAATFPGECDMADLSDAAYRTHHEGLSWSNGNLLDGFLRKSLGRVYLGSPVWEAAVEELIAAGWWVDEDEKHWRIVRHLEDQLTRAEVEAKRAKNNRRGAVSRSETFQALRASIRAKRAECAYCGSDDRLQVDHIIPVTSGGDDEPDNLQVLCITCNGIKSSRDPKTWIRPKRHLTPVSHDDDDDCLTLLSVDDLAAPSHEVGDPGRVGPGRGNPQGESVYVEPRTGWTIDPSVYDR